MSSAFRGTAVLLSSLLAVTCRDAQAPPTITDIVIEKRTSELSIGDTMRVSAQVRAGSQILPGEALAWTSSNTTIASIDEQQVVHAKAAGSTTIQATSRGYASSFVLSVSAPLLAAAAMDTAAQQMSSGADRSCAVSFGRVYCWGNNIGLGVAGTARYVVTPQPVVTDLRFKSVTVGGGGGTLQCGVTVAGNAACWGGTSWGVTPTPAIFTPNISFTSIATGYDHACGVDTLGDVWCFGRNESGQLGSAASPASALPRKVNLTEKSVAIAASNFATCALSTTGVVSCWGAAGPHLGRGESQYSLTTAREPAPVQSDLRFSRLYSPFCALTRLGQAYCWGTGGQSPIDLTVPTAVAESQKFVSLSVGWDHACGIEADAKTYCWTDADPTPHPVASSARFETLAAGQVHTCGITENGQLFCWGSRRWGVLADGYSLQRDHPAPVATSQRFMALSTGSTARCALTSDGRAYCWGWYPHGEMMGQSGVAVFFKPTELASAQRFKAVDVGVGSTCFVDNAGAAWCTGDAVVGAHALVRVTAAQPFSQISAGSTHACALTASGAAFCWGRNESGQLGTGDFTTSIAAARPVVGELVFSRIDAGTYNTCGLTTTGAVYCWGLNTHGKFGRAIADATCGSTPCSNSPRLVPGLPPAKEMTASALPCITDAAGLAYCWGFESATGVVVSPTPVPSPSPLHGLEGIGALDANNLPYRFAADGAGSITLVPEPSKPFAAFSYPCGLDFSGIVYCWGDAGFGGVGDGIEALVASPVAAATPLTFGLLTALRVAATPRR